MSPYGRREGPKIVTPKPKPNPEKPEDNKELIGGLKNALERGESIEKAKKSFTSAGYKKEKTKMLTKEIAESITQTENPQPLLKPKALKAQPLKRSSNTPQLTTSSENPTQKKPASKKFIIIIAIIGALVLVSVGLIGLFWNKIF